jgi:hypothetical protein
VKTVISASRRTDIPAFYLEWFITAIKTGYVDVQNPYYTKHTYRIDLTPDRVAWIVFWSRNYSKLLAHHQAFAAYHLFFHFTILSHHMMLEKTGVSLNKALQQMERLVKLYGADHIVWRYDPIVIWRTESQVTTNFNAAEFENLCIELCQMGIRKCYFSFVTPYQKFIKRFVQRYPHMQLVLSDEVFINETCKQMVEITAANHIQLYSCCNEHIVSNAIKRGSCICGSLLNQLAGAKTVSEAKVPTRSHCGCSRSIDIGSYIQHPCPYGCIYCYANPAI